MTIVSSTWVVTLHFNRGRSQNFAFSTKDEAKRMVNIAVFNNEDCINCSIYRHDIVVEQPVSANALVINV